ncbi:MAG: ParB/RepB/Spo0J family partition protein [Rhizobiales bacterium]|nr:ParB/RepB/Spo0J family partition protein [Hyphomicrobiales bacterium]
MTGTYKVEMILIEQIRVINSRERSEKSFQEMKNNISRVGLKKPITVRPSDDGNGYDLVCGEGRLKAFIALGERTIPAIVRYDISKDDAYVMSLVENMARRQHTAMDLLKGIKLLEEQGYGVVEISKKIGIGNPYVSEILNLFRMGEERLLSAVEKGQIPLSVAKKIAFSPENEQKALQEAYENNELRGKKLILVQRLLEKRRNLGKGMSKSRDSRKTSDGPSISARQMMQKFQTEIDRMSSLVEKSETTNNALLVIVESFFNLLKDDNFINLMRAENFGKIPKDLMQMIKEREKGYE